MINIYRSLKKIINDVLEAASVQILVPSDIMAGENVRACHRRHNRKENINMEIAEKITNKKSDDLICEECGSIITHEKNEFKLNPLVPISQWDKDHKVPREYVYVCCNKIRMISQNGNLASFDIPKFISIIKSY